MLYHAGGSEKVFYTPLETVLAVIILRNRVLGRLIFSMKKGEYGQARASSKK